MSIRKSKSVLSHLFRPASHYLDNQTGWSPSRDNVIAAPSLVLRLWTSKEGWRMYPTSSIWWCYQEERPHRCRWQNAHTKILRASSGREFAPQLSGKAFVRLGSRTSTILRWTALRLGTTRSRIYSHLSCPLVTLKAILEAETGSYMRYLSDVRQRGKI